MFSFGIVLFEMVSGRRPIEMIDPNQKTTLRGFVDNLHKIAVPAEMLPSGFIADVDEDSASPFQFTRTTGVTLTNWPHFLYQIASLCTKKKYLDRPPIQVVHNEINSAYLTYSEPQTLFMDERKIPEPEDTIHCTAGVSSSSLSFPVNFLN